jgi:hypothetical protein
MLTLNKGLLLGILFEEPKRVYSEHGAPQCSFTWFFEAKWKSTRIGYTCPSISSASVLKKSPSR